MWLRAPRFVSGGPRGGLVAVLDSARSYQCAAWLRQELGRVWAIPAFDPNGKQHLIPYLSFLAGSRPPNEPNDPRRAADGVPTTQAFIQAEPGIVGLLNTVPVLLDGYCRSVLFMRSENLYAQFLVWVPVVDNP